MFDHKDIIVILQSKGFTFASQDDRGILFVKELKDTPYIYLLVARDWHGSWAVDMRFTELRHKIELRSGMFSPLNPEFPKIEAQFEKYVKACIELHQQ